MQDLAIVTNTIPSIAASIRTYEFNRILFIPTNYVVALVMNHRIWLRSFVCVFLFVILYVSYHTIPSSRRKAIAVTNGPSSRPSLASQLQTEIVTSRTEAEKNLPENSTGTGLITQFALSESATVKNDAEKKSQQFENDAVNNKVAKQLLQRSRNEVKRELPPSVIDHVKTFVFFLGHSRSGHSIVGSIIDSHPNMVVASEVDVFTRLSDGSLAPIKSEIFNALWGNTREDLTNGLRAKSTDGKGYNLFVDGLYEGSYVDHIDVIGDKKGGITTNLLATEPDKWLHVYDILISLNVTIKVIFVVRNAYDNIGTSLFYGLNSNINVNNFGRVKQSNNTYNFDPSIVQKNIERYFFYHQAIADARKKYNLDVIEIHITDLISDPRGSLLYMCDSLGVTCSDKYLEICSNKIFKTESRTRHLIRWTDEQLTIIQQNIEKYSCLKDYNFYSS